MSDTDNPTRNVFENQEKTFPTVPVTIFVGGERKVVGLAAYVEHEGHVHVSMDIDGLTGDEIRSFLGDGMTAFSSEVFEENVEKAPVTSIRHESHKPATNFGFPEPPGPINRSE